MICLALVCPVHCTLRAWYAYALYAHSVVGPCAVRPEHDTLHCTPRAWYAHALYAQSMIRPCAVRSEHGTLHSPRAWYACALYAQNVVCPRRCTPHSMVCLRAYGKRNSRLDGALAQVFTFAIFFAKFGLRSPPYDLLRHRSPTDCDAHLAESISDTLWNACRRRI